MGAKRRRNLTLFVEDKTKPRFGPLCKVYIAPAPPHLKTSIPDLARDCNLKLGRRPPVIHNDGEFYG